VEYSRGADGAPTAPPLGLSFVPRSPAPLTPRHGLRSVAFEMAGVDVLLCMPPPWGRRSPPHGIAYLSTYLRQVGGLACEVYDLNIELYNQVIGRSELDLWDETAGVGERHYWSQLERRAPELIDQAVEHIAALAPRVAGFAVNYKNHGVTNGLIARLAARLPDTVFVIGGPQTYYLNLLGQLDSAHTAAHYAIVGEGEIPLLALARRVLAGEPVEGIAGVGRIGSVKGRLCAAEVHADLDAIPFPTFEEFDLTRYHPGEGKELHLPVLFTRGCPQRCTFCTDYKIAGGYRNRSVEQTVLELRHHRDRYGVRFFHFNDLQFNSNHRLLHAFCEEMERADLGVTWASYGTVHRNNTPELYAKLKRTGYHNIHFGFEHASTRVLKTMNKRYDTALASTNIREASAAGLGVAINLIVGYPGETEEDIAILEQFLRDHAGMITEVVNLSTATLMVGADLETNPERFGMIVLSNGLSGTWCDESGENTYRERLRRAERIRALLGELGIPIIKYNIEEDLAAYLRGLGLILDPAQREGVEAVEGRLSDAQRALRLEHRDLQTELARRDEVSAHLRRENERLQQQVQAQGVEMARAVELLEHREQQLGWVRSRKGWLLESPFLPRFALRAALWLRDRLRGPAPAPRAAPLVPVEEPRNAS